MAKLPDKIISDDINFYIPEYKKAKWHQRKQRKLEKDLKKQLQNFNEHIRILPPRRNNDNTVTFTMTTEPEGNEE
jgi:hypothetical protein